MIKNELVIIGIPFFSMNKKYCLKLLDKLLEVLKIKYTVAVSLHLINTKKMKELNKKYRNKDKTTDVLSFPIDSNINLLENNNQKLIGDIFISKSKIKANALNYGHSKKREFSYIFLHSILHLLGYTHSSKINERKMNAICNDVLNFFNIKRYN